ncbi:MAG: hypothetical protein RI897_4249 [Verrucomicrobiota bacterium]|jgi:dTDP-4-dehydrorhamnose 3,5-epimerase-like enzyme
MDLKVEEMDVFRDVRGLVFEPLGAEGLVGQRNVHVVVTEPGMVRGNHVHQLGTEVLVVVGEAEVRLGVEGEVRCYEVPEGGVYRFVIPPGVAHAVRHGGVGPGLLVSFSTREHDPAVPDTVRVELF